MSGTVAAVREETLLRKNAIAISQHRYRLQPYDWKRATRLTQNVLKRLMAEPLSEGAFWNVNLPAAPESGREAGGADEPKIVFCDRCTHPLPTEFAVDEAGFRYVGAYEQRPRDVGADVDVCFSGNISVVKIQMW